MKKKLLNTVVILFVAVNCSFAQEKVERYCEVTIRRGLYKSLVDYGGPNIYFKDSTIKQQLEVVTKMSSAAVVLNYMNSIGWNLVSTVAISVDWRFYFKRTFDKSEVTIENTGN